MEEKSIKARIWNEAGRAGLALGGLCVVCMVLSSLVGKLPTEGNVGMSTLSTFLSFLIWAVKFGGCIWLMMIFMKALVRKNPDFTGAETLKFGTASALLSAIIVAGWFLCYVLFIAPDTFTDSFNQTMSQMGGSLDANGRQLMDKMKDKMPVIGFFSQLIYCFLYGYVLSLILSRNIPSRNPFQQDESIQNADDDEQ